MIGTIPTAVHQLRPWVDVSAMAVGAAFAAHVARRRRVPPFGVLFAGIVGGLAGGMARDVLLGLEPAAITTWYYVPVIAAAAVIGGLAAHRVSLDPLPFVATQAFAIGLLIVIGVQKAVAYHTPGAPAILIGVIAATFGGTVVDLITRSRVTIMSEGPWYLGVIVVGAVTFWLMTIYVAFYPAVAVTVILVITLRVLSVRYGWTSPVFPADDLHSADP